MKFYRITYNTCRATVIMGEPESYKLHIVEHEREVRFGSALGPHIDDIKLKGGYNINVE